MWWAGAGAGSSRALRLQGTSETARYEWGARSPVLTLIPLSWTKKLPLVVQALEGVGSAVLKRDTRADHQVLNGAGHQDLARGGGGHDPGGDVDRDPAHVVAAQIHLAGVEPGSRISIPLARSSARSARAQRMPDRARRRRPARHRRCA
jgi:hypothetical protein